MSVAAIGVVMLAGLISRLPVWLRAAVSCRVIAMHMAIPLGCVGVGP